MPTSNSCSGSDMPTGDRRAVRSTTCLPLPSGSINPRTPAGGPGRRPGARSRRRSRRSRAASCRPVVPRRRARPPCRAPGRRSPSPLSASSRAIRAKSRIMTEPDHVLSAISRWNEAIASSAAGRPICCGASEQPHAVTRTAELARQVSREVAPLCAAPGFGGQLCGSLEGRDRDIAGPAKRCPVCCRFECLRDLLVRSGCGRGAMPTARSGSSAKASARAACALRSWSVVAACFTAETIKGSGNRNPPESSVPRPATTAGARSSGPSGVLSARLSSARSRSSSAARRSSLCTSVSRVVSLEANVCSSRAVSGRGPRLLRA